jgi:hypothetical protein
MGPSLLQPLPSLLVFGPQTELPSQEVLAGLREELTKNPSLSSLRVAVEGLPRFWQTLTDFDPDLRKSSLDSELQVSRVLTTNLYP